MTGGRLISLCLEGSRETCCLAGYKLMALTKIGFPFHLRQKDPYFLRSLSLSLLLCLSEPPSDWCPFPPDYWFHAPPHTLLSGIPKHRMESPPCPGHKASSGVPSAQGLIYLGWLHAELFVLALIKKKQNKKQSSIGTVQWEVQCVWTLWTEP